MYEYPTAEEEREMDERWEAQRDAIADDLEERFLEWCEAHDEDPTDEDVREDFFNR